MNNSSNNRFSDDNGRYTLNTTAQRMRMAEAVEVGRKKRRRRFFSSAWVILVSCLIAGTAIGGVVFNIKEVAVNGNQMYDDESVISGAGISRWSNYLFVTEKSVTENLRESHPAIREVELKKTFPSAVELTVKESTPAFYLTIGNFTYILDDALVVHRKAESLEEAESLNIKQIHLSGVTSCLAGAYIETNDKDIPEMFATLCEMLKKYELFGEVSSIHFENKFDISFTLGSDYTVKIGNILECEAKISYVKRFLPQILNLDFHTVDITDENVQKIIISKR